MFEQIGGMRPWPAVQSQRERSGPRPISGFGGQFSGSIPGEAANAGSFPYTPPSALLDPESQAARIAGLSQVLGIPEATAAWLITQELENPTALRQALGGRSRSFAKALEQRGAIPSAGDVSGVPLGEILAQTGEIREEPLNRALRALNARLYSEDSGTFVDEAGYQRDLDSGAIVDRATADPTERPINAADLSGAELAALLPESRAAEVLPYAVRALSPAEKQAAFQESGASRTRGGQRNAFAKEPRAGYSESTRDVYPGTTLKRELPGEWSKRGVSQVDPDGRYTWFTPGSVLGAGMEPSARSNVLPLLVAPASQERPDRIGVFQGPRVHIKSAGGFVPALGDARILDINPLAELSPAAAAALEARLGESFYTTMELDKSDTGGYAGRATNAPIPDPATGAGGFDPIYDPATSRAGTMANTRPMTVAEAVSRIATRNLAPISPVMVSQLRPGGNGAQVTVVPPTGEAFTKDVYPLGIPSADEKNLPDYERLLLQAQRQGSDFVDVRVGSAGRYGPGLYSDLDALVGVLAGEAFPDARARFQLQATASDLETRSPITVNDPYRPVAVERPVGNDWSLLINSAGRDDLVAGYQRGLLTRAGMEIPVDKNPLLALVGNLKDMAGVPVGDVPMAAAAPAAQRVARDGGLLERALQQAKIQANRGARGQLVPSDTGSGVFPPDTSRFERKNYEQNARATLAGVLGGRIPLAGTPVAGPQRVVSSVVNPNAWIDERPQIRTSEDSPAVQGAQAEQDPFSRAAGEAYELRRQAQQATPATVLAERANQAAIPGLEVPYSSRLYTPDPMDEVAQYMARQAVQRARARLDDQHGGLRVIGPDPTYQLQLPSQFMPRPNIAGRVIRR